MSIDRAIDLSIALYMTRFEALKAAVSSTGSQAAFARALEVAQPTVWRWVNQTKQLPAEYVLRTEAVTGISRHSLRPDIYPREVMVDQGQDRRLIGIDRAVTIRPDERHRMSGA